MVGTPGCGHVDGRTPRPSCSAQHLKRHAVFEGTRGGGKVSWPTSLCPSRYMFANSGLPEVLSPCARLITQIWRCPKGCCSGLGASETPDSVCAGVLTGVCTRAGEGGSSLPPCRGSWTGHSSTACGKVGAASPPSLSQGGITFKGRGKQNPTLSPNHTGLGVWSSGVRLNRQEPNWVQVCCTPLRGLGNRLAHL